MAKLNGIALAAAATGALFMWSGIKGGGILPNLQNLIQGKPPSSTGANPIVGSAGGPGSNAPIGVAGPNPTGNAIASDALQYKGAGYVWGGAPAQGIGNWDCSSFCNWVIGHDMGMAIPGYKAGTYTGAAHGPPTVGWLAWIGSGVTRIARSQLAAGDICCWQTHMGIAISNTQMISAQTPGSGTQIGTVDGFIPGEVLFCLRLKNVSSGNPGGGKKK